MTGKFMITVGCPGSGKSTFASTKPGVLRLERDAFREALFGSRKIYHDLASIPGRAQGLSMTIGGAMYAAMKIGLEQGQVTNVIMSDTGLAWDAVKRFWSLAWARRMEIEVILFEVPWALLEERNLTRSPEHRVPIEVLKRFYRMQHGMSLGDEVYDQWWLDRRKVNSLIRVNEKGEVL